MVLHFFVPDAALTQVVTFECPQDTEAPRIFDATGGKRRSITLTLRLANESESTSRRYLSRKKYKLTACLPLSKPHAAAPILTLSGCLQGFKTTSRYKSYGSRSIYSRPTRLIHLVRILNRIRDRTRLTVPCTGNYAQKVREYSIPPPVVSLPPRLVLFGGSDRTSVVWLQLPQ